MTDPMEQSDRQVSATYIVKQGFHMEFTEMMMAYADGFAQLGHVVEDEITDKDRAEWSATQDAIKVLNNSDWWTGEMDADMRPLERKRFVPEETTDEWLARYREAKANGWSSQNFLPRAWTNGGDE